MSVDWAVFPPYYEKGPVSVQIGFSNTIRRREEVIPMISAADYAALRFLREEQFLKNVGALKGPVVAVMCSDGHQILEKIGFLESCTEHDTEPCQHIIATNGGALVLAEDSPIAYDLFEGMRVNMAACCITNVKRGCVVKQPKTIVLKTHFPCAMALAHDLSVANVLTFQAKGYTRIEGTVLRTLRESGITSVERVLCCVHVNYRGYRSEKKTRCTYAFDPHDARLSRLDEHIRDGLAAQRRRA